MKRIRNDILGCQLISFYPSTLKKWIAFHIIECQWHTWARAASLHYCNISQWIQMQPENQGQQAVQRITKCLFCVIWCNYILAIFYSLSKTGLSVCRVDSQAHAHSYTHTYFLLPSTAEIPGCYAKGWHTLTTLPPRVATDRGVDE